MTETLSCEQVNRFREEGALFPLAVLEDEEVREVAAEIDRLRSRIGCRNESLAFNQPHLCFNWAYRLAMHPAVLDAIQDLLGPNLFIHSSSIFYKREGSSSGVSWHQDGYYWGLNSPDLISAWVALTHSRPENGCLKVIAGSHKMGCLPHRDGARAGNMLKSGLEIDVDVDRSEVRDVILKPGQASLHHVDLVHGSGRNRARRPRIGFAVRYLACHVRQKLPHHEVVLARGRDDYGNYELLQEPPGIDLEAGLRTHRALNRRIREIRERLRMSAEQVPR